MKILIITHGYAPALNARAFRWTALAEHWDREGHEVHVITVRTNGSPEAKPGSRVRVHRVGLYLESLGHYARHSAQDSGTLANVSRRPLRDTAARFAMRIVKKVHDLTWKNLYWPDFALPWIPFAALEARRVISGIQPDLVITVSLPFSSHVAGLLSLRSPKIPWIVDVGDPFSIMTSTPTNNHHLYTWLNERAERAVISRAAAVTVTNEPTSLAYARLFGHAEKMHVIPPMLSVLPQPDSAPRTGEPANRLVYIGTLNRIIRSPDRLLAVFDALLRAGTVPEIELHFYGEFGDCAASFQRLSGLSVERVKVHGLVGREEAMKAVRSARAVVNIGNATSFQVPSKLVEYAASGRPIINLSAGPDDLSVEFLKGIPHVLTLPGGTSTADQAKMLADFLNAPRDSSQETFPDEWLSKFTVETIADSYLLSIREHQTAR